MESVAFDLAAFLRALEKRGWRWRHDLLVHPSDHRLCLRYYPADNRLTLSPQLSAYLARVIVSPGGKGRYVPGDALSGTAESIDGSVTTHLQPGR